MNIDRKHILNLLHIYATNNGDAYRDNKNIARAIAEARIELQHEFAEILAELTAAATSKLRHRWYEDEENEARSLDLHGFKTTVEDGPVQISAACYDYWLDMMPPVHHKFNGTDSSFYFGESLRHDSNGQAIAWKFTKTPTAHWVEESVVPPTISEFLK